VLKEITDGLFIDLGHDLSISATVMPKPILFAAPEQFDPVKKFFTAQSIKTVGHADRTTCGNRTDG
jgi:hypothetical protein